MIHVTNVDSYAQLRDAVARLPACAANRIRVFRGQNRDYGTLIPSRWRAEHKYVAFDDAWIYASYRIIKEKFLKASPTERLGQLTKESLVYTEALIQHYGIRSSYLDVSRDLDTAVWFATRTAVHRTFRLDVCTEAAQKDKTHPVLVPKAWYLPSDKPNGFVYVMDCEVYPTSKNPRHGQVVDLQGLLQWVPAARIQKQQGELVVSEYHSAPSGDLSFCLIAAFRIEQPRKWIEAEPRIRNTLDMFPPPTTDPIYASLLRTYLIFQKDERVWKKTLGIPEYHTSETTILSGPESDAYCKFLIFTEPVEYFRKLIHHPDPFEPVTLNERRVGFKDALLIAIQRPAWFIRRIILDDPSYKEAPPAPEIASCLEGKELNVFIELSVLEMVVPDDAGEMVLRGIWFVWSGDSCAVSRWYRSKDGYPHTVPWIFKFDTTTGDLVEALENQQDDTWMSKELRMRELHKALRVVWEASVEGDLVQKFHDC